MEGSKGGADDHVRRLAQLISDPSRRKAFARDPEQTLRDAGVDVGALPEAVRTELFDLSYEELRALSRVKAGLLGAGVSNEVMAEIF